MSWMERETVARLDAMGFNFSQYLNPVGYIPLNLIGPVSSIFDEAEEDEEEDNEE